MLKNEVARLAGVNNETLRFYERKGLLKAPERTAAGYRTYDAEAVRAVRFIKRAQDLGFTLAEVKGLLELSAHKQTDCNAAQTLGSQKLSEVDQKIKDLQAIRTALEQLLANCHSSGHKQDCPFLEAISDYS